MEAESWMRSERVKERARGRRAERANLQRPSPAIRRTLAAERNAGWTEPRIRVRALNLCFAGSRRVCCLGLLSPRRGQFRLCHGNFPLARNNTATASHRRPFFFFFFSPHPNMTAIFFVPRSLCPQRRSIRNGFSTKPARRWNLLKVSLLRPISLRWFRSRFALIWFELAWAEERRNGENWLKVITRRGKWMWEWK